MRDTLLILNFFINCVCVFAIVLETHRNVAVYVGQRTSFKCETSNESVVREWIFYNGTSTGLKVFSNWASVHLPSIDSGYGVYVDSHGSGEVYINNTQMENAGKYTCLTDVGGKITRYSAELVVLETEPMCTETKHDGVTFEAECSVNLSGSWLLKMEWTHNKEIYITSIYNTTSNTRVNSKVEAVIRTKTFTISCTIRFDHSSGSGGVVEDGLTATNVPEYVYVWNANIAHEVSGTSTAHEVSDTTRTIGTAHNWPVHSGGIRKSITLIWMWYVAALVFASN